MSKQLSYIIGILLTIIIGAYFQNKFCCEISKEAKEDLPIAKEAVIPSVHLQINNKEGNLFFKTDDNFNFYKSDYALKDTVSENLKNGIYKIINHLQGNSDEILNITGLYAPDEKNTSIFPNLGIARANVLKDYISGMGLSASLINTLGKQSDNLTARDSVVYGPLEIAFSQKHQYDADYYETLKKQIQDNPLVINFDTGQTYISLTDEQRQQIANISAYLDKVEEASLTITGHTDNTGDDATNYKFGQERADFLKDHFTANGISQHKINTVSKGSDEPVATNDTEEGKARNRRTEISLN